MALDREKIFSKQKNKAAIHLYDSVDSTNNEAKRHAREDSGDHLYAASHQSAGRGRRGHSFYSPADTGLYMTLSLPCSEATAGIQLLTCAAAVAVCKAVEALSPIKPAIKWVNDVFADGKKAAGILTELVTDSDNRPLRAIIGIGINLRTSEFPEEIAASAGSLGDIDPEALCAAVSDNLIDMYGRLDDPSIIESYRSRSLCPGKMMTYQKDGAVHTALAVDIDSEGGLVVEENGERFTLRSGEVSIKITDAGTKTDLRQID